MLRRFTVVLATTIATGCNAPPERAATADLSGVRAQLDSLWSELSAAMTAGDTAALSRFYTDSAVFAETGAPTLRGRAAIVSATAAVFACCSYVESRQQIERMDIAGNRALQFGTYRDVIQPRGQLPLVLYGRFDAVLERDSASQWRIGRLVVIRDSSAQLSTAPR